MTRREAGYLSYTAVRSLDHGFLLSYTAYTFGEQDLEEFFETEDENVSN